MNQPTGVAGGRVRTASAVRVAVVTVLVAFSAFALLPGAWGTAGAPGFPAVSVLPNGAKGALTSPTFPTPIQHVFTVFLENQELSSVNKSGPYELSLARNYSSASNYYSPCHPSAPNYLSATSGKVFQCGSDGVSNYTTENIGDLANKAGLSWSGFFESMPSTCDTSDSMPYVAHHNPFVYYADIRSNKSYCAAHDQKFSAWYSDVTAGTIPNYAFFAPNMTNDGHNTGTAYADAWLKGWLAPYLNATWFASSVWFITWDEGTTNTGCCSFAGGHLFFTAVSPYSKGVGVYSTDATHYSLLSTTEWLLGLTVGGCGNNDNSSTWAPMKGLFNFSGSPPPPTQYAITGHVSSVATGTGIAGATVSLGAGASTTTDATGAYSLTATNGTYSLTASATGFTSLTSTVTVQGASVTANFNLSTLSVVTYPITGTVTYARNGTPAVGATVGVVGGPSTRTVAGGAYALSAANGTLRLTAWHDGSRVEVSTLTVAGVAVVQNFALRPFLWSQTGVVVDATSGAGIPSANVSAVSAGSGGPTYNQTHANGAFVLNLANGSYSLTVAASGHRGSTTTVTVAGAPSPIRIVLSRLLVLYSVSGQVLYASNSSVAGGVALSLNSTLVGVTSATGQFMFWATNGSYALEVDVPGWQPTDRPVVVSGIPVTLEVSLAVFTFNLTGSVTFTSGAPVSGATIVVNPGGYTATTSADGGFDLQIPNGTYTVSMTANGAGMQQASVAIQGGAASHHFTVDSSAPTGTGGSPSLGGLGGIAPWLPWALLFGGALITLEVGLLVRQSRQAAREAARRRYRQSWR